MLKFLLQKKNYCTSCNERFKNYDELLKHTKEIHKHVIQKCNRCGKQFLNEKERLHHIKEEKQRELEHRRHKKL
jgi:DNA-directed RNA polymerase subunit RPC12/RpoP